MQKIESKLQVVTACEPRSLVILLDASLLQYEKLKNNDINVWSTFSIFTYQQIAQRLTTMHALGKLGFSIQKGVAPFAVITVLQSQRIIYRTV